MLFSTKNKKLLNKTFFIKKIFNRLFFIIRKISLFSSNEQLFFFLTKMCYFYFHLLVFVFVLFFKKDIIFVPISDCFSFKKDVKIISDFFVWPCLLRFTNSSFYFLLKKAFIFFRKINILFNFFFNKFNALLFNRLILLCNRLIYFIKKCFPWYKYPFFNDYGKSKIYDRDILSANYIFFLFEFCDILSARCFKIYRYFFLCFLIVVWEFFFYCSLLDNKLLVRLLYFINKFCLKFNEHNYVFLFKVLNAYLLIRPLQKTRSIMEFVFN